MRPTTIVLDEEFAVVDGSAVMSQQSQKQGGLRTDRWGAPVLSEMVLEVLLPTLDSLCSPSGFKVVGDNSLALGGVSEDTLEFLGTVPQHWVGSLHTAWGQG